MDMVANMTKAALTNVRIADDLKSLNAPELKLVTKYRSLQSPRFTTCTPRLLVPIQRMKRLNPRRRTLDRWYARKQLVAICYMPLTFLKSW